MRILSWAFLCVVVIVGLNLTWLATSTVRIENASGVAVSSVAYRACETTHDVGTMRPGQSLFRFLEACGDDTLEVIIGDSKFCQTYVEDEMYHVDAVIHSPESVNCTYDDLLSSLFVAKVLR